MPSTREIRRRIRSVKNVGQITKAVQLVASTKMRRAQERAAASRPYSEQLVKLLSRLAAEARDEDQPLMRTRAVRNIAIVLVSPDRGLAGALPSNLNRRAGQLALELRQKPGAAQVGINFIAVGKKGRDWVVRSRQPLIAEFTELGDLPTLSSVRTIARTITDAYLAEQADQVFLVYPRFVSNAVQTPTAVQLLPVEPPAEAVGGPTPQYIFEPDAATIFGELLPRYIETQIYQPLLESVASFYSAQMVAMKNATDNANELVSDLTLTYNKVRQTAITTQILEIVAGSAS
jgi:F-type H+-transporting ATPase subunit gamma